MEGREEGFYKKGIKGEMQSSFLLVFQCIIELQDFFENENREKSRERDLMLAELG